jgi:hypothetical protein
MKLILIRAEFQALSFNRGDKILVPQPSAICMLMVGAVTKVMCWLVVGPWVNLRETQI